MASSSQDVDCVWEDLDILDSELAELEDISDTEEPYCPCGRPNTKTNMIGCDGEQCIYEWFHFKCVDIEENNTPEGNYICPYCTEKSKKKKGMPKSNALSIVSHLIFSSIQ